MKKFFCAVVISLPLIAAGCSGAEDKPAVTSTEQPGPGSADPAGAPKVEHPLDTARFEQDPCSAVPLEKAAALIGASKTRLEAGAGTGGKVGNSCFWGDKDASGISVGFVKNGIEGVYQRNKILARPYFIPVSVDGYPGVLSDEVDNRASGRCVMVVGLSDSRGIVVGSSFFAGSPYRADPCPVVQKYAEAAITTMRGGA